MPRKYLFVVLVVAGLILPSAASACERCALYRVCAGDVCWWTSLCTTPSYPTAGWSECDDTWVPCTNGGQKCQWVFAPQLEDGSPDASSTGA
jgi:hypothetical protein